jgi:hydroxyacylglutathione hydrolase
MNDTAIDFVTDAPTAGSLDVRWIHGSPHRRMPDPQALEPKIQVHNYDEQTVIMRQGKSVSFEAPFLFLFFGNDRALLLDSGATADPQKFPLRATVDALIERWLAVHPRESYELVVAHTHGHNDHVAGDAQFSGRPNTTVVGRDTDAVREYFGFSDWPAKVVTFDLGGRVLEIMGSPGHHKAAITVYDPWTGFLLTGDTVLPGRLYAFDFAQFRASLERMVEFAAERHVTHVLGCHIEMTRQPGRDYPLGARYQPDEPALEMTVEQLTAVRDAAASVAARRGVYRFDDFILYNQPGAADQVRLMARGLAHRVMSALRRR